MKKLIFKKIESLKIIIKSIGFGMQISWKASPVMCLIRILFQGFVALLPILLLFVGRSVIDYISTNRVINVGNNNGLIMLLLALAIVYIVQTAINYVNTYIGELHQDLIQKNMQIELSKKVAELDIAHFDTPDFYNEVANTNRDSYAVPHMVFLSLDAIRIAIQLCISFIVLLQVNSWMPAVLVLTYIPLFFVNFKYMDFFFRFHRRMVDNVRKRSYFLGILQMREVAKEERVMGFGKTFFNKFIALWDVWYSEKKKHKSKELILKMLTSLIPEAAKITLFGYVAFSVFNARMTIGDYALYTGLIVQLAGGLVSSVYIAGQLSQSSLKVQFYKKFFRWKNNLSMDGTKKPAPNPLIELKNVSFSYPNTDRCVLNNVSMIIRPNEKIALVGQNGAGKSTIVKLILRLYDVDSGAIYVNGINVKEYDIKEYRRLFSIFFEDFFNYALPLRESIRVSDWGECENTDKLIESCKKAQLEKIIDKLPLGLDNELSRIFDAKNGAELSRGEKQRIGLARTWYRDADIMLFDEPTAALDAKAEQEVFKIIENIASTKTVIYISHRLSNMILADRIYVLENGTIIEEGTHAELINNKNIYADLFETQASRYHFE